MHIQAGVSEQYLVHQQCLHLAQELDPQPEKVANAAPFEEAGQAEAEPAAQAEAAEDEEASTGDSERAQGPQTRSMKTENAADAQEGSEDMDSDIMEEPVVPEIRLADAQNRDPGDDSYRPLVLCKLLCYISLVCH